MRKIIVACCLVGLIFCNSADAARKRKKTLSPKEGKMVMHVLGLEGHRARHARVIIISTVHRRRHHHHHKHHLVTDLAGNIVYVLPNGGYRTIVYERGVRPVVSTVNVAGGAVAKSETKLIGHRHTLAAHAYEAHRLGVIHHTAGAKVSKVSAKATPKAAGRK